MRHGDEPPSHYFPQPVSIVVDGTELGAGSGLSPGTSSAQSIAVHPSGTLMSEHDAHGWSQSSSSESIADADDSLDDYEMTDVEEGGAPLAHDAGDDIVSPFTGNVIYSTPFVSHHDGVNDLGGDDSVLLNAQPEPPTPVALNTTDGNPPASQAPPAPVVPAAQTQMPLTQLPVYAPQVLSTIQPHAMQLHLQQQILNAINNNFEDDPSEVHPMQSSNPNPMSLGPDNPDLFSFLRLWGHVHRSREGQPIPHIDRILAQLRRTTASASVGRIEYDNLAGDQCDFQGINWQAIGVTRSQARGRRRASYNNYVNKIGSDQWHPGLPDRVAEPCENYFRFRSMDVRHDVRLLHFQLRNILGCASRTRTFFPSNGAIRELDPTSGRTKRAMKFSADSDVQISTLTAEEDILVAGGFLGDYRFRNINSEDPTHTEGKLTDNPSGITNHVQIHTSRKSSGPVAAFASNDFGFRTVDLTTNTLLSENIYEYPLNCSAISTDQRLRVMVGDHRDVLITDVDTGAILRNLEGHRDFGFACAWAPDGWTVATGFQDKTVRIWDARNWAEPIAVLRMDMAGARSLRFSPLGSGKRLLVAAEEADVINIFDAQSFDTQQKLDVFGEIAGTAFADNGNNLMALVADHSKGGLIQFARCDQGAEDLFEYHDPEYQDRERRSRSRPHPRPRRKWWSDGYDWSSDRDAIMNRPDCLETMTERRRNAAALGNLEPF